MSSMILLSLHPQSMCQNKSIISIRRWRGHLEAPRGFFSLPWKGEEGVSELFFEVRVVGGAARCREGELNVAQLVTGEGGDKLLLRGGLLGIQVGNTQICKSLSCSTEWIECTQCQLEGLVFWTHFTILNSTNLCTEKQWRGKVFAEVEKMCKKC